MTIRLLIVLTTCGCMTDLRVPADAQINCTTNRQCPEGWRCDDVSHSCMKTDRPPPRCGDGNVDEGEECDCGDEGGRLPSGCSGPNSDTISDRCRTSCVWFACGDLGHDSDEECDDGNNTSGDGCSAQCERELCGNTREETGEDCDDGNLTPGDGCNAACRFEVCGNGVIDLPNEQCDCGVDEASRPEWCDVANGAPGATCTSNCETLFCGNGVQNAGEVCDFGDNQPNDGCSPDCLSDETCGNNYVDFHLTVWEVCDDGNQLDGDGCSADCRSTEVCGNDTTDTVAGEECDDGGFEPLDGCGPTCLFEACGNGFIDLALHEECDDGNALSHDGCSSGCTVENLKWTRTARPLSTRVGAAMEYDSYRRRLVFFGGSGPSQYESDTWEFDGRNWVRVETTARPEPRLFHRMVFDPDRRVMVLWGGLGETGFPEDTWEYDGLDWTEVETAQTPQGRSGFVIAYDTVNDRVLMSGGARGFDWPLFQDTWAYEGTNWTLVGSSGPTCVICGPPEPDDGRAEAAGAWSVQADQFVQSGGFEPGWVNTDTSSTFNGSAWPGLTVTGTPGARRRAQMVSTGAGLLLYGGLAQETDTWLLDFDGAWTWAEVAPETNPNPDSRMYHAMAYDSVAGLTYLFGGNSADGASDDLWTFDGSDWEEVFTFQPPVKSTHDAVWDSNREVVVLFTGTSTEHTWEFDGRTWHNIQTATTPPIPASATTRDGLAMAYDPVHDEVVMFGGGHHNHGSSDTWVYDGLDWQQRATGTPSARRGHTMAWFPPLQRVILFAGNRGVSYYNDTWQWNGTAWSPVTVSGSLPTGRTFHGMTLDSDRERLVMFGGQIIISGSPRTRHATADTWEFSGTEWLEQQPVTVPAGRQYGRLVYDPDRQRTIMFGGSSDGGSLFDTWEWDGQDWDRLADYEETEGSVAGNAAVYHPYLRAIVAHKYDVWQFRYASAHPEEVCYESADEDGDELTNCADPDCDGLPCARLSRCVDQACVQQSHVWDFERDGDGEGWFVQATTEALVVAGGIATVTSNGNDPMVTSPALNESSTHTTQVVIHARAHGDGDTGGVHFATSTEPSFTGDKLVSFTLVPGDPGFTTYTVDMSGHAKWTGAITGLRLDLPQNGAGIASAVTEVDWIDLR